MKLESYSDKAVVLTDREPCFFENILAGTVRGIFWEILVSSWS